MSIFGPPYPVLETVIVNLKSGKSFRGVVWDKRNGYLILRNAELLRGKNEVVPMDGELLIPSGDVEFMQIPQEPG